MPEVGFDCFDRVVVEEGKDRMENIIGSEEPIA
jgi:hypothetical protein